MNRRAEIFKALEPRRKKRRARNPIATASASRITRPITRVPQLQGAISDYKRRKRGVKFVA